MTFKKKVSEIFAAYDKQLKMDMAFWLRYRPSRWLELLPGKLMRPLLKIIRTNGGKKFVLISAFIFSLIFVGVFPTFNFIWSNIFRLWLILLIIPLGYWLLAITSVYARLIVKAVCEIVSAILDKLIDR